jgi:hypothetical protein
MGLEYHVYLGPYIQFKTKKIPQRQEEYEKFSCRNEKCPKFDKGIRGDIEFCAKCGKVPERQIEHYQEDMCLFEYAEKMGIEDEVNPDFSNEENGDTQIWFPNLNLKRHTNWDVKYDEVWEDLSTLNVQEEIELVKIKCARAIEVLEAEYGVKAEIRWGLISSIS